MTSTSIGKKSQGLLKRIAKASQQHASIYPGVPVKLVSHKRASALWRDGLITTFIPHNPAHDERWVVTEEGLEAIAKLEAS